MIDKLIEATRHCDIGSCEGCPYLKGDVKCNMVPYDRGSRKLLIEILEGLPKLKQ
jgi:hypothetical protein